MRALISLALVALIALSIDAGNRHYRAGEYEAAAAEYRRALERGDRSPALHYNLGTALLRLGRYAEAREQLELASRADDDAVRQRAHYNLGNGDLEPAFRAPHDEERIRQLERAIAAYRAALLLDPDDADAKWNLELAQRLLQQQLAGGAGGGGGEGADETRAQPDPQPDPAEGAGAAPQLTPAEAEQVLHAAELIERELQQEKLQRVQAPPPNVRDW